MSPEQLAERYRHAVRSNAGQLRDSGGDPSEQMISQLVSIAEEHAREVGAIAVRPADDCGPAVDAVTAAKVTGEPVVPPVELIELEPKTVTRRRAPARGRAK
jgi:hypothetical protein